MVLNDKSRYNDNTSASRYDWYRIRCSHFDVCGQISNFSRTQPLFTQWSVMQFDRMVWIRYRIIFQWLSFLIKKCHCYIWVAIVSWLNYLILDIDLSPLVTSTMLHYMVFIAIPLCGSDNTLVPWGLLFSDKLGRDIWDNVEAACLNIAECDFSGLVDVFLSVSCISLVRSL